jgi:hypothetical protein
LAKLPPTNSHRDELHAKSVQDLALVLRDPGRERPEFTGSAAAGVQSGKQFIGSRRQLLELFPQ